MQRVAPKMQARTQVKVKNHSLLFAEHIRAIADSVRNMAPRVTPERSRACRLSGLEPFNIEADSLFATLMRSP